MEQEVEIVLVRGWQEPLEEIVIEDFTGWKLWQVNESGEYSGNGTCNDI